ncbi:hypothetical protein ACRAWF_05015 [Streptomyces sp. L7]
MSTGDRRGAAGRAAGGRERGRRTGVSRHGCGSPRPGRGPERLVVKGAYTYDKPRAGAEVEVPWLRRRPSWADTCMSARSARARRGRWSAFSGGGDGRDALVAFVLAMVIGCVLAAVFTFTAGPEALQRGWPGHLGSRRSVPP